MMYFVNTILPLPSVPSAETLNLSFNLQIYFALVIVPKTGGKLRRFLFTLFFAKLTLICGVKYCSLFSFGSLNHGRTLNP